MPENKDVVLREDGNVEGYLDAKVSNIKKYKEYRDKIDAFIKDNLDEGIDYGHPFKGAPKTLLLPGAQKISRLLSFKPMFFPDTDTWKMLGSDKATVAFTCYLMPYDKIDKAMEVVATLGKESAETVIKMYAFSEGRGAGKLDDEKTRMKENALVKKTQKRAFVDAVIRIADLSDKFTQDMDELGPEENSWDNDPLGPVLFGAADEAVDVKEGRANLTMRRCTHPQMAAESSEEVKETDILSDEDQIDKKLNDDELTNPMQDNDESDV